MAESIILTKESMQKFILNSNSFKLKKKNDDDDNNNNDDELLLQNDGPTKGLFLSETTFRVSDHRKSRTHRE